MYNGLSDVSQPVGTPLSWLSLSRSFSTCYTLGYSLLCSVIFCWCLVILFVCLFRWSLGYLLRLHHCLFSHDSNGILRDRGKSRIRSTGRKGLTQKQPSKHFQVWNYQFLLCSYTMILENNVYFRFSSHEFCIDFLKQRGEEKVSIVEMFLLDLKCLLKDLLLIFNFKVLLYSEI